MGSSGRGQGPGEVLEAFAGRKLGDRLVFVDHTVPFGEARVWSVRRDGEILSWLKLHRNASKTRQERRAYKVWGPQIGWGFARWMGRCKSMPAAMMVGHVAGLAAAEVVSDPTVGRHAYEQVGRFLAQLHAVSIEDPDPVPLHDAIPQRAMSWADRADGIVDDHLIEAVREALLVPLPEDLVRVPCHRDLHLDNVIVGHGEGRPVTVLDFGLSRPDVWLSDLVKLFELPSEVGTSLREAFFRGYGRKLTSTEHDVLVRLRALHGLATWTMAAEAGDERTARQGRRILTRAVDELVR